MGTLLIDSSTVSPLGLLVHAGRSQFVENKVEVITLARVSPTGTRPSRYSHAGPRPFNMAYVSCARLLPVVCCAAALLLCSFWCGGGLPHETLRCRWDGPFGSCLAAPRSASPLGQSRASGLPHLCTVSCTDMLNFCAQCARPNISIFLPPHHHPSIVSSCQ